MDKRESKGQTRRQKKRTENPEEPSTGRVVKKGRKKTEKEEP